jgi:hypothetical protein
MNTTNTWLDSEPCPVCGTGLHCADDDRSVITQDCPACGWTAITDLASRTGGSR